MDWSQRILEPKQLRPYTLRGSQAHSLSLAIDALVAQQETTWTQLQQARTQWFRSSYREIDLGPFSVLLQHNASREESVSAQVDAESVRKRNCFLCSDYMPETERSISVEESFALFLNPFPIFYPHVVIVHRDHRPQNVFEALPVLIQAARRLEGRFSLLYNGPRCGASAPDHLHVQAIPRFQLPVESDIFHLEHHPRFSNFTMGMTETDDACFFTIRDYARSVIVFQSSQEDAILNGCRHILEILTDNKDGEEEPMINLLCWYENHQWTACFFPRRKHRPEMYSTVNGRGVLVSPGAIDLGGVLVTPRWADYEILDVSAVRDIFRDVCFSEEDTLSVLRRLAPKSTFQVSVEDKSHPALTAFPATTPGDETVLRVGLLEGRNRVDFCLRGNWKMKDVELGSGWYTATVGDGDIILRDLERNITRRAESFFLCPEEEGGGRFMLRAVTIGIHFHWQQDEDLVFPGSLELTPDVKGAVAVLNHVPLEEYLSCVVSSEMKADAPKEFLKAHAVISRSWLLAQLAAKKTEQEQLCKQQPDFPGQMIRWTDRSRHETYDVCADDHCQRYQGITRISCKAASQAVKDTRGMVLAHESGVCDARFSKCCGGMSESFRNAWSEVNFPELKPVWDGQNDPSFPMPLTLESNAQQWISGSPKAFCNVSKRRFLEKILPDFDLKTGHFFRWKVKTTRKELEEIIQMKTGWDPGRLLEIRPVRRGFSGRLSRVLLVGSRGELLLGKELEIRRALSRTHLYSAAFFVEVPEKRGAVPEIFTFTGAGWGHGVGLCQIGAAVMAEEGFDFRQILDHYFPGTRIVRWYE